MMLRLLSVLVLILALGLFALLPGCGEDEPPAVVEEEEVAPEAPADRDVDEEAAGNEESPAPGEDLEPEEEAGEEDPSPPPSDQPAWLEGQGLEGEKTVIVLIEGMEEEVKVHPAISAQHPFALYLDQSRYILEEEETKSVVRPLNGPTPPVFMSLEYQAPAAMEEVEAEITALLEEKHGALPRREQTALVPGGVSLTGFAEGASSTDPVDRYYFFEDGQGGVFIARQALFLEAVEGHGARFDALLQSLHYWDSGAGEFKPF